MNTMKIDRRTVRRPAQSVAVLIFSLLLSGCGGTDPETAESTPASPSGTDRTGSSPDAPATTVSQAPADSEADSPRRQDEVWTDSDGQRYLGKVPFDAFFDQPYIVASNLTPLNNAAAPADSSAVASGAGGMGSGGAVAESATAGPDSGGSSVAGGGTTVPGAAAGGGSWDDMLPMEVLDKEITTVRNFLNGTLQSVGSYNSSMLMIPPKAATIAVLAEIALQHSADLSWKEDAAFVRDLAKRMNESTLQRGKKDQSRLLELFENMTDTFNRSRPAGLEEPPAEDSFADVAEMRLVMMRMEEAQKRMKTEAGSESAFDSKKDMIRHESSILQTLTKVIALEEYGYGDDAEFTGYAKEVMDAAAEIRNATEANDFGTYEVALSKISTTCQQCHSVFKNN
ncbi:MAG: hypothetical protein RIK87_18335 [Fuerstiella sp.]